LKLNKLDSTVDKSDIYRVSMCLYPHLCLFYFFPSF